MELTTEGKQPKNFSANRMLSLFVPQTRFSVIRIDPEKKKSLKNVDWLNEAKARVHFRFRNS